MVLGPLMRAISRIGGARNLRLAATYAAIAAMMLRALLPEGWMPGTTPSGMPALVICSMDEPVQIMPDHGMSDTMDMSKPMPAHGDNGHHETCPFAAAPHFAAPAGLPVLAEASATSVRGEIFENFAVASNGRRHSPQAPRAPPALA
jgi:hypothetical protein